MLALVLALQATEDASLLSLRFLSRHQRADGSWGERPETCVCAEARVPVAADPAPLLRALGEDDPARRDEAEKGLRAMGAAALPKLREALKDPDAEVRARAARLCARLDLAAAGAGDVELTGLALLAFLGAGYSHLSKDAYEGVCFGGTVRKSLQWLIARQKEAGAFDAEDGVADAVAALALSEAYGMTGSQLFKDDAQKGIDRTAAWAPKETRGRFWKGMALKSAEISGLTLEKDRAAANLRELEDPGDFGVAAYAVLSIFVEKRKSDPRLGAIAKLSPAALEPEALYVAQLGAFQYDGPSGPLWKAWNPAAKERVWPAQCTAKGSCERGSWEGKGFRGRLRGTALHTLTFEIYYAYSTVTAPR